MGHPCVWMGHPCVWMGHPCVWMGHPSVWMGPPVCEWDTPVLISWTLPPSHSVCIGQWAVFEGPLWGGQSIPRLVYVCVYRSVSCFRGTIVGWSVYTRAGICMCCGSVRRVTYTVRDPGECTTCHWSRGGQSKVSFLRHGYTLQRQVWCSWFTSRSYKRSYKREWRSYRGFISSPLGISGSLRRWPRAMSAT